MGRAWLAAGAAAGALLAAIGILNPETGPPGETDWIARIGPSRIARGEYERALARLAADKRNPLSEADRAHVLERLIDEELLVLRGLELGLAESDRAVRAALVNAVIQSVLADAESDVPDDAELAAFHAANSAYFSRPARLRVVRLVFRGERRAERATEAARALTAGEDPGAVRDRLADPAVLEIPDAALPPAKLREYLGPSATEALLALEAGDVLGPRAGASEHWLVFVREVRPGAPRPLAEVRDAVASELRRRTGDRALREYLAWLRDERRVELAPDAPGAD